MRITVSKIGGEIPTYTGNRLFGPVCVASVCSASLESSIITCKINLGLMLTSGFSTSSLKMVSIVECACEAICESISKSCQYKFMFGIWKH